MSIEQNQQPLTTLLEQALKLWHQQETQVTFEAALPRLTSQTKVAWQGGPAPGNRQVANKLLLGLLETLAEQEADAATLLRRRYIDDRTGFAVANSLGISESAFYRRRRNALSSLADLAAAQEEAALVTHTDRLENRLELPSYHHLFGLDNLRTRLGNLLCQQSDIRLICLTGIGGIGKTSLADALARDIIARGCFDDLAWVSARQQQFAPWGEIRESSQPALTAEELITSFYHQLSETPAPPRPPAETLSALKTRLNRQSHLLILDNLETAADYRELLPLLRELSQSAWILLTSRMAIHEQPEAHVANLTELSSDDAEALVRAEAARRGIDDLAAAPLETMAQIYDIAGGNPLALKLIIGQVQLRSLPAVLADFNQARGQRVEALYEYIYRRAWGLLDDPARRVLLTMPLVAAPGTTLEHLAGVTGLDYDVVGNAIDLLIRLSLLNVGGSLQERRYSIHRLTETFLHKQVTKWI